MRPAQLRRTGGEQRGQPALIALVQVLALAVWFSASAVVPSLQVTWEITPIDAVWLTASVQVGFVVGAVASALLNLADRVPATALLAGSAMLASAFTITLALVSNELSTAIPLRFLTGVCLAGVYPVGMKLMVSWAPAIRRGGLMGVLLAALTLGSTLPHLLGGLTFDWRLMLVGAGALTFTGGILALAVRPGPYLERRRTRLDAGAFWHMLRDPIQRKINLGYYGHMWELYALWTWAPVFVVASGAAAAGTTELGLGVFLAIGIAGVVGCLIGGWASDRWGRRKVARLALLVSGLCCLASPFAFDAAWPVLLVFGCLWGAAVIADSGVFSTMLSEVAPPRQVGTALTAQTAIGFLLTVVSIQIVPLAAALVGWRYAFIILAIGPLVAVVAFRGVGSRRRVIPTERKAMSTPTPVPVEVGSTAEMSRTITPADIALFSAISGDFNPLHYDADAAKRSRFGEIVVQGGVTTAILNAVVAERLPGPGTVFLNTNLSFRAPARPGDTIVGRVEVTGVREDKPIVELTATVTRGDGTVLVDGTAVCYTMAI